MMNWLDITVLVALLVAFVFGLRKGLVMQLAGLASIILASIFGGKVAAYIAPYLEQISLSPIVAGILSYALAFVLIAVVLTLIGEAVTGLLKTIQINFINRILGGLVAIGAMMVVLSILLNMALLLDPNEDVITKNAKEESFFYGRVQVVVPAFVPYLQREVWKQYLPPEKRKNENEGDGESISKSNIPTLKI
ncbi:MAG: CvpA family protein [Dysgonamonadaceae bacterium]|jgi:membrane protein required for colicin V production|nr:CvpA family protein [Dysgonamonadaceae bacterium]